MAAAAVLTNLVIHKLAEAQPDEGPVPGGHLAVELLRRARVVGDPVEFADVAPRFLDDVGTVGAPRLSVPGDAALG